MNLTDFVNRADEIIAIADRAIPSFTVSAKAIEYEAEDYAEFRAAGLSFLANTFGDTSVNQESTW